MARANAFAQYMLELVNQFRLDPRGEHDRILGEATDPDTRAALDYFGVDLRRLEKELDDLDPVQPLAWNGKLADSARGHSKLLRQSDSQSHQVTSLGEPQLQARVQAEGYDSFFVGENVFSYSESARHAQDGFIVDWGYGPGGMQPGRGHRANLIGADFTEVGIGVVKDTSASTAVGRYVVTQDFGDRSDAGPYLLGVAYKDRDDDGFYSKGEGLDRLKVEVEGAGRTRGADAGGYSIEAGQGELRVKLRGGGVDGKIVADVAFGDDNVKLDVVDKRHLLTTADLDLKKGAKSVSVIGTGDVDVSGRGGRDRLYGNDGRNRLDGENGDDRLYGDSGKDRLIGGDGKDKLVGGNGSDVLFGGDDRDVFVFDRRDGRDRIRDWDNGDEIRLEGASKSKVDISSDHGDAIIEYGDTTIVVKDQGGDIGWGDIDFA